MSTKDLAREITETIKKINKALAKLKAGDNSEALLEELGRLQEHADTLKARAAGAVKT
jgi:uncharacterized protein Yka (UPF0111/DUF47 family)